MKTHTKKGRLTRYGLACGYVERVETDTKSPDFRSVELGMSGSVLYIRTYERAIDTRRQLTTNRITIARLAFKRESEKLMIEGRPVGLPVR